MADAGWLRLGTAAQPRVIIGADFFGGMGAFFLSVFTRHGMVFLVKGTTSAQKISCTFAGVCFGVPF